MRLKAVELKFFYDVTVCLATYLLLVHIGFTCEVERKGERDEVRKMEGERWREKDGERCLYKERRWR